MTDTPSPSAWKPLIDEWVDRESRVRPHTPIRPDSVRVRDAVEIDDQAYILVSFDTDRPWPAEEDTPGDERSRNTAVLQAARVRTPWSERDATRALSRYVASEANVCIHEHLLGTMRAWSGTIDVPAAKHVAVAFDDDHAVDATVVDGWFLAVAPSDRRIVSISIDGGDAIAVTHDAATDMYPDPSFQVASSADPMYFSPLDIRAVLPIVQWQRSGSTVVVATSIEQYDDGGVLRLRIDGIRLDDDTFVTWPMVALEADGQPMSSAVCGEFALADTISLDIGFKPWLAPESSKLLIRVEGMRGPSGQVDPVVLEVTLAQPRS